MRTLFVFVLAVGVLSGCAAPAGQMGALRDSSMSSLDREHLCKSYRHDLGC
ncbi:MAG: hypothetical protein V7606_2970 [Burkholderiales bacterium]|jgi:hypothetical protein